MSGVEYKNKDRKGSKVNFFYSRFNNENILCNHIINILVKNFN